MAKKATSAWQLYCQHVVDECGLGALSQSKTKKILGVIVDEGDYLLTPVQLARFVGPEMEEPWAPTWQALLSLKNVQHLPAAWKPLPNPDVVDKGASLGPAPLPARQLLEATSAGLTPKSVLTLPQGYHTCLDAPWALFTARENLRGGQTFGHHQACITEWVSLCSSNFLPRLYYHHAKFSFSYESSAQEVYLAKKLATGSSPSLIWAQSGSNEYFLEELRAQQNDNFKIIELDSDSIPKIPALIEEANTRAAAQQATALLATNSETLP